jgi:hypothetical protein
VSPTYAKLMNSYHFYCGVEWGEGEPGGRKALGGESDRCGCGASLTYNKVRINIIVLINKV